MKHLEDSFEETVCVINMLLNNCLIMLIYFSYVHVRK